MSEALLQVRDLRVAFVQHGQTVNAVRGLDLLLQRGERLGVIGESGSGKSQTFLALTGLLAPNGRATGEAQFQGEQLLGAGRAAYDRIRGRHIGMVFQDPLTALNPYLTLERQLTELLVRHRGLSRRAARERAIEMLDQVDFPDAARRIDTYPHEISGGMRQRIVVAMALLCTPELLIADEPTTALDVTVQAQVLLVLRQLVERSGSALVLITHDLGVVAEVCQRVVIMHAGRIVEAGTVDQVLSAPVHPYTAMLIGALVRFDQPIDQPLTLPGRAGDQPLAAGGCRFRDRCALADKRCSAAEPLLREGRDGRQVACHAKADYE
jgi:oligopeptide transport system ATP-binding protein